MLKRAGASAAASARAAERHVAHDHRRRRRRGRFRGRRAARRARRSRASRSSVLHGARSSLPAPSLLMQSLRRQMRRLMVAALALAALAAPAGAQAAPHVLAVHFDAEVNPATQSYLSHQIERAAKDGYDAVVILLDTPGGLSESMRKIVQSELSSTVPVVVYVWPQGARAASAGVWIGQAADILAMAPQTNIGSSTPISSSGQDIAKDLRKKVVNDAAASLRSLAKSHGRNAEWADKAVREASNLTAQEALDQNVIDLMAPTLPALLEQDRRPQDGAARLRPRHGGRGGDPRRAGVPHAAALDADRPEHPLAALPRGDRRDRLRGDAPGRRAARRARRGLAADGALRLLGASDQLGGRRARPARDRAARDRRARDDARRADPLRASSAWRSG